MTRCGLLNGIEQACLVFHPCKPHFYDNKCYLIEIIEKRPLPAIAIGELEEEQTRQQER